MLFRNRLLKEIKDSESNKSDSISLQCVNDDMLSWEAHIRGPEDTPFSKRVFDVKIKVPREYPLSAPSAWFITKIFHPNVHFSTGEICLDILKTDWTPAWTLLGLCRAIQSLLAHPEPSSPLNCDAGNLLRQNDIIAYNGMATYYSVEFARTYIED